MKKKAKRVKVERCEAVEGPYKCNGAKGHEHKFHFCQGYGAGGIVTWESRKPLP